MLFFGASHRVLKPKPETPPSHPVHEWFKTHRFLFLLFTLMLLFVLHPLTQAWVQFSVIMDIFISAVLLSAIYAVGESKRTLIIGLFTALPAFLSHWINWFLKIPLFHWVDVTAAAIFTAFATFTIVGNLFKHKKVTSDLILGAVCGYFLIGLMWAFVYAVIELIQPGSFTLGHSDELNMEGLIYFSFVTLCTVGYGDITPLTEQARALAILEAVMGQMYLAVNIAALVAIRISQNASRRSE